MGYDAPAFQFYAQDWLSSTAIALMTVEQEGAYVRLLAYAWTAADCGLPADDRSLSVLTRLGDRWEENKAAILACFEVVEGRIFNKRLSTERIKMDEYREAKSEAGRIGGVRSGETRSKTKQNEAVLNSASSKREANAKQNEADLAFCLKQTRSKHEAKRSSSSSSSSSYKDQYADTEETKVIPLKGKPAAPSPTSRTSVQNPASARGSTPPARSQSPLALSAILQTGIENTLFPRLMRVSRDPTHYEPWWLDVQERMEGTEGLYTLEQAVKYAEDCSDEAVRRSKDLGPLKSPGGYIAKRCEAWLHRHGMTLPAKPKGPSGA